MFTLAQPHYGYYNLYEELAMQQELQRRRQLEGYLRRQREAEEAERRRQAYEAAVRAEYERRREAELERQRQVEFQRRRQAQQARGRHLMYDGGLESLFDALYGGQSPRQRPGWENRHEEPQPTSSPRKSPSPARGPAPTPTPDPTPTPAPAQPPAAVEPEPEPEEEPQIDTAPSYAAVQSILGSFKTLQSEFTFPTQLDFLPGSSKLAYTPNNAPLHGYEHALTGLLTQLDAVESYGDEGVRRARKEAVKTIEKELEGLDGMKADAWSRANEPQAQEAETEVDPADVPLPEDEAMQEAEQTPAAVEEQIQVDQRPASEQLAVPEPSNQTGSSTPLDTEGDTSLEHPTRNDSTFTVTSPTPDTDLALQDDLIGSDALSHTPHPDSLTRSLTSPTPSEASETDSDMELEEYVDVETMSTSEDEDTELKVEKDGDLEPMGDWGLDF